MKPSPEVEEPAAKVAPTVPVTAAVVDMSDDDEDEGLEFYDPQAEERELKAKKIEELQRNQQANIGPKVKTKAAAAAQMVASMAAAKPAKNASSNGRFAMFQQLESARL